MTDSPGTVPAIGAVPGRRLPGGQGQAVVSGSICSAWTEIRATPTAGKLPPRSLRPGRRRALPGRCRTERSGNRWRAVRRRSSRWSAGSKRSTKRNCSDRPRTCQATYRMMRDEVIEASWKAGRELNEPRLDTAIDVNRAITRYLELLKLAALAQRPDGAVDSDSIDAINGLLAQVATPEQLAELDTSTLDPYLLANERDRGLRQEPDRFEDRALTGRFPAEARGRPAAFGIGHRPLPDLPAQVQVRAGLRHPAGTDHQPAFRHPHPQRPPAVPRPEADRTRRGRSRPS